MTASVNGHRPAPAVSAADVEQAVRTVRERIAAAQRRRARAEAEHDAAAAKAAQIRQALLDEFGVTSVEEARAMLTKVDTDLTTALYDLEQALTEAEGQQ